MKKLVLLTVCICLLTLSLASCAHINTYKNNLQPNYRISSINKHELAEIGDFFLLDPRDYKIKSAAEGHNEEEDLGIIIFECASLQHARALTKDIAWAIEDYDEFEVVGVGRFVFFGHGDAIDTALCNK